MKIRMLLATVCASLLVVPAAFAELSPTMSLVGDVETNTTVESYSDDESDSLKLINDGRTHIKFEGRTESETGYYGYAKGDAMISTNGTTGVDDAYVQFGTPSWAFRVGRYEAEDLFSKGEDVYIAEPHGFGGRYQGNYARGRSGTLGNLGMIFKAGESATIYIDSLLGNESKTSSVSSVDDAGLPTTEDVSFGANVVGFRPMVVFAAGNMTVKAGFDYLHAMPQNDEGNDYVSDKMGGALDLATKLGTIDLGAAVAYGIEDGTTAGNEDATERTILSTFVYTKVPVGEANLFGLAAGFSNEEKDLESVTDKATLFETYATYVIQMPVDKLKMKLGASYAVASFEPEVGSDYDNGVFGARVRFNYDF